MTGLIGGFIVVDKQGVLMDFIYRSANFDDVSSVDICYWRHPGCYWVLLK